MQFEIEYFSADVMAQIAALPKGLIAKYIGLSKRMEAHGPDLGMPHTRAMGGGLLEMRLKGPEGIARIFYCTLVGRRIVILHGFIKKTDKTPAKELSIAQKRMQEVRNAQP
jgi:phage-related protein